jgi:hypothetical protein
MSNSFIMVQVSATEHSNNTNHGENGDSDRTVSIGLYVYSSRSDVRQERNVYDALLVTQVFRQLQRLI